MLTDFSQHGFVHQNRDLTTRTNGNGVGRPRIHFNQFTITPKNQLGKECGISQFADDDLFHLAVQLLNEMIDEVMRKRSLDDDPI